MIDAKMNDRDGIGPRVAPLPDRPPLVGLQYLRALAVLMVVLDHVSTSMGFAKYQGHVPFGGLLTPAGAAGVELFFCLSGFIMVYIALDDAGRPRVAISPFLRARFARIVPFMWVAVIAYATLRWAARGELELFETIRALFLIPFGHMSPPQVWTLSYEALFYIVFAVTMLGPRPMRWLFWLWIAVSAAALPLLRPLGVVEGVGREIVLFLISPINLLFALGMVAGFIHLRLPWNQGLPAWAGLMIVPIGALLLLVAHARSFGHYSLSSVLIFGSLCSLCLLLAAQLRPGRGPVARIGKLLGDSSYSAYLTHGIFLTAVLGLFGRRMAIPDAALLALATVASIAGGVVAYRLVERPVVGWARRVVRSRAGDTPHGS